MAAPPQSGVVNGMGVARRAIIKMPLVHLCALSLSLSRGAMAFARGQRLNWNEFVERLEVIARTQHLPKWDEEQYVRLAAAASRSLISLPPDYTRELHKGPYPGMLDAHKTVDVQITLLNFESGQFLPHHNHPSMTGVMLCTNGAVCVDEYDEIPEATDVHLIQFRGRLQLNSGRTTSLTSHRANIHRVFATERSEVVDIFTPPYSPEREQQTHWYNVEPYGSRRDVFKTSPYS